MKSFMRFLPLLFLVLFSSTWALASFSPVKSSSSILPFDVGALNPLDSYNETMVNDITIYDEYLGKVNRSTPMYWGNYSYFMNEPLFFVQVGGVHNHAYFHTYWNMTPYITSFKNTLWLPERNLLLAFENQTRVGFSNGSKFWIPMPTCPLGNRSMHALEFSRWSRAVYWFCPADHRLIIGEILS